MPCGEFTAQLWARLEPVYRAKFRQAMDQVAQVSQKAARDPVRVKISNDDMIDDPLTSKFIVEILGLFDASAKKARMSFGQRNADQWEVRSEPVYKQLRQHAIKLVQSTIDDMLATTEAEANQIVEQMRTDLLEGQQAGETLKSKTDRLARHFGSESRWKARRIAVTESARG